MHRNPLNLHRVLFPNPAPSHKKGPPARKPAHIALLMEPCIKIPARMVVGLPTMRAVGILKRISRQRNKT
jgi:hypothetical protein